MKIQRLISTVSIFLAILFSVSMAACGGSSSSDDATSSSDSTSSSASSGSSDSDDDYVDYSGVTVGDCASDADIEVVVCAANAFYETLSSDEQAAVLYDWSDSTAKTIWSNLPGVTRNGLAFGDLDADSRLAAMVVAKAALSDAGFTDFLGILAGDDYLNSQGGGGPMGGAYSSDNYHIAFIGMPSVTGDWMIQIGGHHLAYNITYISGTGYPVPNHIGVEPKGSFEIHSSTYAPLADEGNAMVAMFTQLSDTELDYAYLSGESYADVLVGPDNGSGTLPTDYPQDGNRKGILVSDLTADQQAVVTAAVRQWVDDYPADVADKLMEEYTSAAAYADTYIAWAGSESSPLDIDKAGTYMRIDGPRLWIELVCQDGVIVQGQTHYHTMFRDKLMDYGNSL